MTRVALVGGSATGKSVIACRVASAKGIRVRHCGEEVKTMARARGIPFGDLDDEAHRSVDRQTRTFAEQGGSMVVEGRFLRFVLAMSSAAKTFTFIELHAAPEARRERLERRSGKPATLADIVGSDSGDEAFAARMYAGVDQLAVVQIDTTLLDEDQVVAAILDIMK